MPNYGSGSGPATDWSRAFGVPAPAGGALYGAHDLERLQGLHRQFMRDMIEPIILPAAENLIAQHRAAGDTLLIVTADHGEEFFDHGRWQHGFALYHESIHVPFIIKFPSNQWAGRTVSGLTGQVDLLPTLLDYLEAGPIARVAVRSQLLWFLSSSGPSSPYTRLW